MISPTLSFLAALAALSTAGLTAAAPATASDAAPTLTSSTAAVTTGLRGLNTLAKAKGRYFGAAVDSATLSTDTLSKTVTEFGILTPKTALIWATTEPSRNAFTFSAGDVAISAAITNGQTVRGHTFVWHSQLPSWVTSGGFTSATLTSVIQNHVATIASRYKGKVYAWDVVNELWNEDGSWRNSVFYTTIGTGYPVIALKAARAADASAKLYINDYNIEGINAKSTAMYNLAITLLAQGVPLQGIGIEGHLTVGSVPTTLQANIQRFADLGLEVAFTELEIALATSTDSTQLAQQALDYAKVVQACVSVSLCAGISTWGTTGTGLLFNTSGQPKVAYYAVANVLEAATVVGPL